MLGGGRSFVLDGSEMGGDQQKDSGGQRLAAVVSEGHVRACGGNGDAGNVLAGSQFAVNGLGRIHQ